MTESRNNTVTPKENVVVQVFNCAIPTLDHERVGAARVDEPRIPTALGSGRYPAQSVYGHHENSSHTSRSDFVDPLQIQVITNQEFGSALMYGKLSHRNFRLLTSMAREGNFSQPLWFEAVNAKQQFVGLVYLTVLLVPLPAALAEIHTAAAGTGSLLVRKLRARAIRLFTLIGIPSIVAGVAKLAENL